MSSSQPPRVVITGMGLISPLGHSPESLLTALRERRSGIRLMQRVPPGALPIRHAAEAQDFTGAIGDFGPLAKEVQRTIRKGQKLMCREIEMGVAAAQLALHDAGLTSDQRDPDRTGVVYGCDYIMTEPDEFAAGITRCQNAQGEFEFNRWAEAGLPQVNPLWLLKYLPNMPASHIAIYNDLRGPNNSLTVREASPGAALAEAYSTLSRGHADALIVGATGSRVMTFRSMHANMQEPLAADQDDPAEMSRPFAADRQGAVLGEGAAAMILETEEHARKRGAQVLAEVLGSGTSAVGGQHSDFQKQAIQNALRAALRDTDAAPGHVHAHGVSMVETDRQEAQAIAELFGGPDHAPPVVAAKRYFGNLGAGGGMVEVIASLLCLQDGKLFATLGSSPLADDCPIRLGDESTPAGDSFVSVNVTPQGQASAVRIGLPRAS